MPREDEFQLLEGHRIWRKNAHHGGLTGKLTFHMAVEPKEEQEILRRLNCHSELLAVVEAALPYLPRTNNNQPLGLIERAEAAVAAARGEG